MYKTSPGKEDTMPNTGGFDVMLQFKQDIINDILVRVLNESLFTDLHLKSPLTRLINEPVPPTQVKVWWDKPEIELDDADSISLSVDVTGGARQLVTGRNLSVDGSVSITRKAQYAANEIGVPYLHLESPQSFDLHMSKAVKLDEKERQQVAQIRAAHDELDSAYELTQAFVSMLTEHQETALDIWLAQAEHSGIKELKSFALGIRHDYAAVRATFTSEWSNGPVEAQVNCLKL
jgi:Transposase